MHWPRGSCWLDLADRLEEGQALDVADRAADLDQDEVVALIAGEDEFLDRVGDVRDDLDRRAEIVAAALLGQDVHVDAAGGDVVALVAGPAGEALVMAEIEIGLGAVIGDEDLAMLIRAHRARIDIEIGVELAQADRVAARLQEGCERRRRQAFAERGHHAAGDENVPRHGRSPLDARFRFAKRIRAGRPRAARLSTTERRPVARRFLSQKRGAGFPAPALVLLLRRRRRRAWAAGRRRSAPASGGAGRARRRHWARSGRSGRGRARARGAVDDRTLRAAADWPSRRAPARSGRRRPRESPWPASGHWPGRVRS